MPTYEYSCRDCGEPLEVVQSIHDDSLTTCPKCGGSLRKLFGNVGVVFKGSGFYKNDSRAGNKGKDVVRKDASKAQVAKTQGAGGGSGSEAKTEPKASNAGSGSSTSTSTDSGSGSSSGGPAASNKK